MLIAVVVMILADGRRLQRLCEEEVRETLPQHHDHDFQRSKGGMSLYQSS